MYLVPVYTKESQIQGKGVFTSEEIQSGQVVWQYNSSHDKSLSQADYVRLSADEKMYMEKVAYLSPTSNTYIFPPKDDPALYTNHSSTKNNLSVCIDERVSPEPYFIANRGIAKDEELVNNYHEFDTAVSLRESNPIWL